MTQDQAIDVLTTGISIFLTGEPGSGKTHTVNRYIQWLREHNIEPAITASTGIAATHIGGSTIHSWSGIGIADHLSDRDLDTINQNRRVVDRVKNAQVLIIDEISMLSANTLSLVDAVCRKVRGNQNPFGGLQMVLVGDFFQLPPIVKSGGGDSRRSLPDHKGAGGNDRESSTQQSLDDFGMTSGGEEEAEATQFAYDSSAWKNLDPFVCYLSEQHRQEDAIFLEMLTALRQGAITNEHLDLLRSRYQPDTEDVTRLYSHNANVDILNTDQLNALPDKVRVFQMITRGPAALVETLQRGCLSPANLLLKVGAKVMFTKNDIATRQYMNGTLGTVIGFDKTTNHPIVALRNGYKVTVEPTEWSLQEDGRVLAGITQLPLRLAWAITVHKSQGMSLDAAYIDLSRAFEYGQGYVALSRLRTLEGLSLGGLNERATQVDPRILAKDQEFRIDSKNAYALFSSQASSELATMRGDFILACGGNLVAQKVTAKPKSKAKTPTRNITKELLQQKLTLSQIAEKRGLTEGTIINHLEELLDQKAIDPTIDLVHIAADQLSDIKLIHAAFEKLGVSPLKPVFERFNGRVSYDTLRLARLLYSQPSAAKVSG